MTENLMHGQQSMDVSLMHALRQLVLRCLSLYFVLSLYVDMYTYWLNEHTHALIN
jgi:hypothetical protein